MTPTRSLLTGAALVLASASAPAALADTTTSSNWSGYVAHRSGVRFRQVSAAWRQPKASCAQHQNSYSAFWVGLGGYSQGSNALEQIGTEVDCTASGQIVTSAWYELLPAPSTTIRMTIKPGDWISAAVKVAEHEVTLRLSDRTRHESFSKRLTAPSIDVSSAEWIAEAPSECLAANQCQTLPLANFGSVRFTGASARTTAVRSGPISSPAWGTTRITLAPLSPAFIADNAAGTSTPSALLAHGSAFDVSYSQTAATGPSPPSTNGSAASAASAVQPGGSRR